VWNERNILVAGEGHVGAVTSVVLFYLQVNCRCWGMCRKEVRDEFATRRHCSDRSGGNLHRVCVRARVRACVGGVDLLSSIKIN
jgi:hypothetical protein